MELDLRLAFDVGEKVRVTVNNTTIHTWLPKYTHNHIGTIEAQHGVHVFADANALDCHEGANLYSVLSEAEELWGNLGFSWKSGLCRPLGARSRAVLINISN